MEDLSGFKTKPYTPEEIKRAQSLLKGITKLEETLQVRVGNLQYLVLHSSGKPCMEVEWCNDCRVYEVKGTLCKTQHYEDRKVECPGVNCYEGKVTNGFQPEVDCIICEATGYVTVQLKKNLKVKKGDLITKDMIEEED